MPRKKNAQGAASSGAVDAIKAIKHPAMRKHIPPVPHGRDARAPIDALFLNPFEEILEHWHRLPHWEQGQAWQFVTWRLADALPAESLAEWQAEKDLWLAKHPQPWDDKTVSEYHERFSQRIDRWLDAGHGSCVLRDRACADIVAKAFRHFDGERYGIGPFVVMPNHVHVLFRPKEGHALEDILHSWKSYTAKEINRALGRKGTLWQEDYWDRMIRNERHWHACRRYIVENPSRLAPGTYLLEEGSAEGSAGILSVECGRDARAPFGVLLGR